MNFNFLNILKKNWSITKFIENAFGGSRFVPCGQSDGRMNGHTRHG